MLLVVVVTGRLRIRTINNNRAGFAWVAEVVWAPTVDLGFVALKQYLMR
jgi:hypothetical protein